MDAYIAVFNVQAKELNRARRDFNKMFGKGSYRERIAPFVRQGIMSIFKTPPDKYTSWYVQRVAELVNKRIGERDE